MKPRNQTEREVAHLSARLGDIGKRDRARLIRNTYGRCAYDEMHNRCYAVINQACKGWQVLRYFRIDRTRNRQRKVSYTVWEVFQFWNREGHRQTLVARQRAMGIYIDTFLHASKLEIRHNPVNPYPYTHFTQVEYSYIYDKSLTGVYRYADGLFDKSRCYTWYSFLSADKYAETLLKQHPDIARYMVRNGLTDTFYFQAVRIAMRHRYTIGDMSAYFSTLRAMHTLQCDLSNPHFVCPDNLEHTHDWAMAAIERRRQEQQRRRDREEVSRLTDENAEYVSTHAPYFGLSITDGTITCTVLRSVSDFYEEGLAMHHCVYANGYYRRQRSLIFSARIGGKRIETVEFSLDQQRVVQAYGACDKFTIHHQRIVDLVNSNKEIILNNKPIAI